MLTYCHGGYPYYVSVGRLIWFVLADWLCPGLYRTHDDNYRDKTDNIAESIDVTVVFVMFLLLRIFLQDQPVYMQQHTGDLRAIVLPFRLRNNLRHLRGTYYLS
jgi:hypothetical protein